MKTLVLTIILVASAPAFACPFHAFFLDDETTVQSTPILENASGQQDAIASKMQQISPTQFGNFAAQLMFWKKAELAQRDTQSSNTTETAEITPAK